MEQASQIQVLNDLKKSISEQYVLESKIPDILTALESLLSPTTHSQFKTHESFSNAIEDELKKFDKHFSLTWSDPAEVNKDQSTESFWHKLARKNSGFNKVEILDGNVGYIDFWGFDRVNDESKRRVANVMSFVADTDAIIFDVRNNGGGSPRMVQLLSSYLFKKRTLLNKIYWRYSDDTDEFWTLRRIKGKKRPNVPVFILTSQDTFSAAEAFAYDLQSRERAIVVGESTGGGAHPMRFIDLGRGFKAGIPYGKTINPITKTNWEWIGVTPNIKTSKERAFDTAYHTALSRILNDSNNEFQKIDIENRLNDLASRITEK